MPSFLTILLIGISLSMDAFALALVYGIVNMTGKKRILLSLIVGIYHFFMPLIGLLLGFVIDNINFISLHIVAAIILFYIGVDLIVSNFRKEGSLVVTNIGLFMFGLSVSIDSLTLGIGLKAITNNYVLSSLVFAICSLLFTYLGLTLGNVIGKKMGIYAKISGGIILIIIAILMVIN